MIRITDLGDGALVMAAGQSMRDEADWRLACVGGAAARAQLAGASRLDWDFALEAFAMRLEGRMLGKEAWTL